MNEQTFDVFFLAHFLGVFWGFFGICFLFFLKNLYASDIYIYMYIYVYIYVDSLKQKQENWLQVEEGRRRILSSSRKNKPGVQGVLRWSSIFHPKNGGGGIFTSWKKSGDEKNRT